MDMICTLQILVIIQSCSCSLLHTFHLGNNIFQLCRHGGLGVLALKMLFVGLGVRHGGPAHSTGVLQPSSCGLGIVVFVVSLHLLQLGLFFLGLGLGLLSLESSRHSYPSIRVAGMMWCGHA